ATPVLAATKFQLPNQLAEHYAVSISGLPQQLLAMVIMGRGGRGRDGGQAPDGQPPADPQAEAKARQDRLLRAATLVTKNHDPQTAEVVLETADKQTLIFGFAKGSLPLAAADKEVEFDFHAGPMSFKAKFELKEMMYKGELTV
ncbi:MAG: hypothetical protein KGN84_02945, partial [Acidobacteriota bacterium]|nr:hypothetical protein [Acidobacteriota bacterium]